MPWNRRGTSKRIGNTAKNDLPITANLRALYFYLQQEDYPDGIPPQLPQDGLQLQQEEGGGLHSQGEIKAEAAATRHRVIAARRQWRRRSFPGLDLQLRDALQGQPIRGDGEDRRRFWRRLRDGEDRGQAYFLPDFMESDRVTWLRCIEFFNRNCWVFSQKPSVFSQYPWHLSKIILFLSSFSKICRKNLILAS